MATRGPKKGKGSVAMGITIPREQEQALREMANRQLSTRNRLIRHAIDLFLKEHQIKNPA